MVEGDIFLEDNDKMLDGGRGIRRRRHIGGTGGGTEQNKGKRAAGFKGGAT